MSEKYAAELTALAQYAWAHPEPGFREFACSSSQVEFLRAEGFEVTENIAGTSTGYMAVWGKGKPVIALLGEFDALWGLQQEADVPEEKPLPDQKMGQGCGHHLLGVGAIAGALMLREIMREKGYQGTIKLFG